MALSLAEWTHLRNTVGDWIDNHSKHNVVWSNKTDEFKMVCLDCLGSRKII